MASDPAPRAAASDATRSRYLGDSYLRANPTWDLEHSPWKAAHVLRILRTHGLSPRSIVEVGCGAGGVLAALARELPNARMLGFDIAPAAARFWARHELANVEFRVADFLEEDTGRYDLILVLDVVEHVADPHAFLAGLRERAAHVVVHFPLDLSASSVLRGAPLLHVRRKAGHLHYYTKDLALALLEECGYEVTSWSYTNAALDMRGRSWKTRLASWPRRLAWALNKDLGVRLLGGETLMVLGRARQRAAVGTS